ncbi:hypothetical protein EN932_22800 [Mesorhizobium sp. M7A.F.Ca.US.002.01.1.1]|uniref:hypothetical protein n=1 Tax=Mesorhizobium sp. M7A.F.Ca.US.002.01.1.1 TaxID=2496700 RepID=UPI000FD5D93C|nr:hypothetical protein [Mesorhizobium sp. M7A.F.Ca.US.002.01.1.1]RVA09405.1 hypothetical protein EN932_22800 [Mesorhizobium sp. M7A.F.Ca.US.002.01.1.1]
MSDIPQARQELLVLADDLEGYGMPTSASTIMDIVEGYLTRRSPRRVARRVSAPMTAELAERIRKFAQAAPHLAQTEIAKAFQVNPGRVSEALAGQR